VRKKLMTGKPKGKDKPEIVAIPPMRVVRRVKVSRSAVTGKFVTDKYAEHHPKTTVKETIKKK
jgi:hypothetical protein